MNMRYQPRPNTGSLFTNDEKGEPRTITTKSGESYTIPDPDYTGSGIIGDSAYWINATIKTSKSGKTYLALKFNPKPAPKPAPKQQVTEDNWGTADLNDELLSF
jgi:hypothetical protein